MFRRNVLRVVLAALFCLMGSMVIAGTAHAAGSCDGVIFDDAHVLGGKASQVQEAAQSVVSTVNADVRVVTATSIAPYATLDAYVQHAQDTCPSWQSPDGSRKSNLLVFAVSMDHKLGIFYGSEWKPAFTGSNSETRIYNDFMKPQFQGGDFAQGLINGMNEAKRVLNNYLHPDTASAKSSSKSSAVPVVLIIVGALLLVGLVIFVTMLLIRRNKRNEERKDMQQRARRGRDNASRINNQLGDPTQKTLRASKVATYSKVSNTVADQLTAAAADVERYYNASVDGITAAAADGMDVDNPNLTVGQYEQLALSYEQAFEDSQKAEAASQQIDAIAQKAKEDLGKASETISDAEVRLGKLQVSLDELTKQGIKTDVVQAPCDEAIQSLESAKQHPADLAVLTDLDATKSSLTRAEAALQVLAGQREELASGLPALKNRIAQVTNQLEPAKECFGRISGEYAESSWESVQGNGTEAENRLHGAQVTLDTATDESSLQNQAWDNAIQQMQQGNRLLDEAESLLRSITELETNLATARQTAPQEIDDAKSDIDKARAYLQQFSGDVKPGHEDDLRTAEQTLTRAKTELSKDKPDYLKVVKLALAANHSADAILADCVSEHEAAERLRRQAASTLTQAVASVSQARQYIQNHHSDVRSGAKDKLRDAEQYLATAQNSKDASYVLRNAKQADQLADDAYSKAKRDHQQAEDDRDTERRRQSSYSSSTSFGVGVGVGSSWGSSSGSGGFDGGGFGGGSSGSFGGGNSGGGSSGSW